MQMIKELYQIPKTLWNRDIKFNKMLKDFGLAISCNKIKVTALIRRGPIKNKTVIGWKITGLMEGESLKISDKRWSETVKDT